MDRSVIRHSIQFCAIIVLSVFIIGCSKQAEEPKVKAEPQTLSVIVFQVDGSPSVEAFQQQMAEYAGQDEFLTVHVTPKAVDASISASELLAEAQKADLIVFPSLLNRQLREQANAFHPIGSATGTPDYLASAFAAKEASKSWASVVAIDPIVYAQKVGIARTAGYTDPMTEWSQLRVFTTSERMQGNNNPFWVFDKRQNGLQDAWTSYLLAYNYSSLPSSMYDQWLQVAHQAILTDLNSIAPNTDETEIKSFPTIANLKDFIQSPSYFTSVRYSALSELSENDMKSITYCAFPNEGAKNFACYTISAAIPLQSTNPDGAIAWLDTVNANGNEWAKSFNCLSLATSELQNDLRFPVNCRFIIRENNSSITEEKLKSILGNDGDAFAEVIDDLFNDFYLERNGT